MIYPTDTKILALDLATTTGYALLANGILSSGAANFSRKQGRKTIADDHLGESFIQFQIWLREQIRLNNPDVIVFEEPMGNFKSSHARNVVVGFRGIVMVNAAHYRILLYGYSQSSIKKFATGSGRADKQLMEASAIMKFPEQEIQDDNQADALFILHYYLDQKEKQNLKI